MTQPAGWRPCSDVSRDRGDPMYGTASAGSSWLMLELCGAWGPSAFMDSPSVIDPGLGRAIVRRAEAAGMRIAAIRRPGRRSAPRRWRWFVADSRLGAEALHHGEVSGPADYLELPLDGSAGHPTGAPLVAVCAHGRHDQCCAVRGRGAAAAIAAAYPEITWECSHLGGDRFAATMLILPEGLCYGRVETVDAAHLVSLYADGRVNNGLLRGRTSLPHVVQAAQYFAREALGEDRLRALAPLRVEPADGTARVTLAAEGGTVDVVVGERLSEPLLSQCSATVPGRVRTFTLVSLERG
ncbi:sucrase ferredoxin [Mycobacterium yunnanensis]|uniref:Sucrase ferredoxin n=1 Tax=Mycobacterium yunnanensis TaxID=368477 RepID=A0A9X2YZB0_9MYCO|nr:sucrase ferredoxin [Mycobacterium yunnanensis]MCV7420315.1 sucrase ferredoxin [Mycobacterium yunnanensis]